MAQSRLDILVAARNNASPTLKQIGGDVRDIDKFAGNAARGIQGLAVAGGVAGIVALGTAAAGAAVELGRVGAQSIDVAASFKSMATEAGESSASMLSSLKEASRGAINDYDLMLNANRAMLLGVAENSEQMAALMDVARARSQAMGMTTAEAFGDIVTGIGRMSPMILDNLGIVVDQAKANEAYAESLGKSVSALSEQEQKQALVNAVLRDSASLVAANAAAGDDMASKYERMDAAIANAKMELGELFSPAIAVIAANLANAVGAVAEEINAASRQANQSALFDLGTQITRVAEEYRTAQALMTASLIHPETTEAAQANLYYVREELMRLAEQYNATAAKTGAPLIDLDALDRGIIAFEESSLGLAKMGASAQQASGGLGQVGLSASAATERLAQLKAQADETAAAIASIQSRAMGTLESAASSAVGIMGASEVSRIYAQQKERLDAQIKTLENLGYSTDELRFKSEELAQRAAAPFTNAVDAAREADKAAKSYAKTLSKDVTEAEREAERAFENLRGKIAGVLSQALDPGVDVDPDELLEKMGIPRADAINENARRLADIAANGLKGQEWLDAFRREVPDIWNILRTAQNPQEEAAHLLRDFQDGLLTSAIDKGKAKEIVRRMLMGEANMAQLAQEIAQELSAEMGVPLQQALSTAQGALGVGGGVNSAGGEAAQTFADGAVEQMASGGGGRVIDEFITQAKSKFGALRDAGGEAGRQWGTGFLATVGANVPPALVTMLTDLVTPGVQAKLQQQASLTGAQS